MELPLFQAGTAAPQHWERGSCTQAGDGGACLSNTYLMLPGLLVRAGCPVSLPLIVWLLEKMPRAPVASLRVVMQRGDHCCPVGMATRTGLP